MSNCEHKWQYKYSIRDRRPQGHMSVMIKKIDVYYCERCLDNIEKIVKEIELFRGDNHPQWWLDMNDK